MTNEQWLKNATTEELAEFLCRVAMTDILWDRIRQVYYEEGKQAVIEWLKEIHEKKC